MSSSPLLFSTTIIGKRRLSLIYGTYRFPRTSAAVLGRHSSIAQVGLNNPRLDFLVALNGAAAICLGNAQVIPYTLGNKKTK